jgi:hypothetical protein
MILVYYIERGFLGYIILDKEVPQKNKEKACFIGLIMNNEGWKR